MAITYGNAIKFASASSQYAARTRVSTATDNVTVAFWLYVDSLPGSTKTIVTNGSNANHQGYNIRLGNTGILQMDMIFVDGACVTTTGLTTSAWNHIVFQKSSGTSQFYINAVANGVTSAATWNGFTATNTTGLGAAFDDSSVPVAATYTDVTMDDVRFYDRAITTTEITSLLYYGININNPDISNTNLVAWWKMDEASGNPVDSSGNGNTLTNGNTATFVTGKVQLTNTNSDLLSAFI